MSTDQTQLLSHLDISNCLNPFILKSMTFLLSNNSNDETPTLHRLNSHLAKTKSEERFTFVKLLMQIKARPTNGQHQKLPVLFWWSNVYPALSKCTSHTYKTYLQNNWRCFLFAFRANFS